MRKIAALGFFALTLSIISSQAIAGKVPVCEAQKDELASLGLYGLCNAYWNTDNENAKARILSNFEEKAGTANGGPGMPGLETPGMACPCWAGVVLDEIGESMETDFCALNLPNGDWAFFGDVWDPSVGAQFYNYNVTFEEDTVEESCLHMASYTNDAGDEITREMAIFGLEDMGAICAKELDDIINKYFDDGNLCWNPGGS
jgi:hypothetical protein